jgi:hypothetical protein
MQKDSNGKIYGVRQTDSSDQTVVNVYGVSVGETSVLTTGVWKHILFTWTKNSPIVLYVNGISNAASAAVSDTPLWNAQTYLGYNALNTALWKGCIDDVCIWTSKLSAAEAQQVYSLGH